MDRLYNSARAFEDALMEAVEDFGIEVSTVVRKSLVDLASNVIRDTPRDTGRAAAGWSLTAGQPSNDVPPESKYQTKYGEKVPANAPPPIKDPGNAENMVWYLVNNLEYIEIIEEGTSDQAPQGMLAVNLQRYAQILQDKANQSEMLE